MQYQSFLIKYAEIGTKGKNRFMFEDALIKQIRFALREVDGSFEVTKESGRIYVTAEGDYDYDDTIEVLKRVFGIADICPMVQIDDRDYENLKKHVVEYMDKVYPDKNLTFKVVARRGDKRYPVSSDQINRDMGEAILEAFPQMRVDVHNPDVLLRVEIRQKVNIFSLMIPGPGGMPVGTNGKAMLLLSGGIDSPVAGYMIAKRGVKIDAVYFHAPPYTSDRAKQKVVDLAKLVARYSGPMDLHVVNLDSYIFGMEESYGYLSGSYVRDKDGVNAAFLICEMFTYYASQGIGLFEKLNELYAEYGYCLNTLHSYTFEGSAGFEKMQNIMVSFRKSITEFAGKKVLKCLDYSEGIDGLPKSDVLKFFLEDNCSIVVRPSGTEPKLKAYISVSATTKEEAQVVEGKLARAVEEKM